VLPGAVEPEPFERLLLQQGANGGDARPVSQALDQSLLAAVGQDIAQPLDLGRLFFTDRDRLVPAPPKLLAPADQPAGLAGEVGVEVTHEERQFVAGLNPKQEVEVIGSKGESTDADGVELLRPAESAEDDLVELVARGEEKAALHGPAGNLDEAAPLGR
jgi:hypothetical protein